MPACGDAENATHTSVVLWSALKGLAIHFYIFVNKSYKTTNTTTKRQTGGHSNTERIISKTYSVNLAIQPMRSCIDLCLNVNMNILINHEPGSHCSVSSIKVNNKSQNVPSPFQIKPILHKPQRRQNHTRLSALRSHHKPGDYSARLWPWPTGRTEL